MRLIEITEALEDQGLDVRGAYWGNIGLPDDHSPEIMVHVAGGSANRPIQSVKYDKENDLIVVEVPS